MRRLFASTALTSAVFLLSACASMNAPKIAAPAAWDSAVRVSDTTVMPIPPDATWWQSFKSDELNQLIAEAQTNNHSLKAAVARILQTEASAKIAGAAFFPTVSAGGSASRSVGRSLGPTLPPPAIKAHCRLRTSSISSAQSVVRRRRPASVLSPVSTTAKPSQSLWFPMSSPPISKFYRRANVSTSRVSA